ncbi:hydrogenase maturation nickel metallochaperone HypA [Streptosporangium carneum]|uniref:Hydrogenase maturation factor HypA n=1 Tax=Streptosporangium carneum TaxID=47481 RepID=A0A9W6I848_9ACTN|nr:hydrogenase maturation nickel metallochaperone HypA [Streptosporangium carneum]GLK13846.1 putative hydrogenase nickel incorporation protein HypA 2 [Streptosporangium carneum]
MHEFGIAEAVLDAVERRAEGRRVERVRVRAGALLRITGPALEQAFSLVSPGTVAEGAAVDLTVVPVRLTCSSCGGDEETTDALAVCGGCGSTDVDLRGGDELVLESIQMEGATHVPGNSRRDRGDPAGPH